MVVGSFPIEAITLGNGEEGSNELSEDGFFGINLNFGFTGGKQGSILVVLLDFQPTGEVILEFEDLAPGTLGIDSDGFPEAVTLVDLNSTIGEVGVSLFEFEFVRVELPLNSVVIQRVYSLEY